MLSQYVDVDSDYDYALKVVTGITALTVPRAKLRTPTALASAICGPLLGFVGAYVQRPGVRGLLAALTVPAAALVQMVVYPPGAGNLIVTPEMRLAQAIFLVASSA